jgi:hypothetical protein
MVSWSYDGRTGMNRTDKMLVASQYARRQVRVNGLSAAAASRVAAEMYGLPLGMERTIRVQLEQAAAA